MVFFRFSKDIINHKFICQWTNVYLNSTQTTRLTSIGLFFLKVTWSENSR